MPTIDEHTQLNAPWPPVGEKSIQSRSRSTASEEHIVDQHDVLILNVKSDFLLVHHGFRTHGRQVVAVERDVERPDGNFCIFDASHDFPQALGNRNSTATDTNQAQRFDAAILFHDFIGQTYKRALDLRSGHKLRLLTKASLSRGSFHQGI